MKQDSMKGSNVKLKEKIKKDVDSLPDEYLPQIEQYIGTIKSKKSKRKQIKTLHLNGKFDGMNIRKIAYE